jgi:hypothetical protein
VDGVVLPDIGQTATLHASVGGQCAVTVLSVRGDALVLIRPMGLPEPEELDEGATAELMWPADRGVRLLPVQILEASSPSGARMWTVRVSGPALRIDRRAYERVPMGTSMSIASVHAGGSPTRCLLVDISEAGLRARMSRTEAHLLGVDEPMRMGVTVDGAGYALLGRVLRTSTVVEDPDSVDVVVLFDIPRSTQDQLLGSLAAIRARRGI